MDHGIQNQENNLWEGWAARFSGKMTHAEDVATQVANRAGKVRISDPGGLSVFSDVDLFGFERKDDTPSIDKQ